MIRPALSILSALVLAACAGGPEEKEEPKDPGSEVVDKYIALVEKDYRDHLARQEALEKKGSRLEEVLAELEKEEFDAERINKLLLRDTTYDDEIRALEEKKDRLERMIRETEAAGAEFDEKWGKYIAEYDRLIRKYEDLGRLVEESTKAVEEEARREGK
jgi:hypothetical protein